MHFDDYLVNNNLLPARELERVHRLAAESDDTLDVLLTRLGLIAESDLAEAYARYLDIPRLAPHEFPQEKLHIEGLSANFLKASRILPFHGGDHVLGLAMSNPLDEFAPRAMEYASGLAVKRYAATQREIEAAIDRLYVESEALAAAAPDPLAAAAAADDIDRLRDLASEAPVIRLVQRLVTQAIERKASDIHIEPMESCLSVRYRIDGMLHEVETLPAHLKAAVVSRVKIMAHLNIAERRLPQDGRIRLTVHGRETDFRIATSPILHGESVVLRILDRRDVTLDFTALGFAGEALATMRRALAQPHGVLLVTGPTGSGKTTTLYAALTELNSPDRKILTAEDPIEYTLERVNQAQVKPQIGHDFAQALRSFLRQDPDIIMVGEIRDVETARIAIQAALTGHLLLSTLHTNSAAGAVTRLLDMGIEDYLLSSTLTLVVGQRLVRRLCPTCRVPYPAPEELLRRFGIESATGATLYKPCGCAGCGGSGYAGRQAITEVLEINEAIQRLILAKADTGAIERCAVAGGMRTMNQDGIAKALGGLTTVEEVLRVTQNL
jgi:general secretion pathway protein E